MALVGIDVSKNKLDVAWLRDPKALKVKTRVFGNNKKAHQQVLEWIQEHTQKPAEAIEVMMEATSVYHEALADRLHQAGVVVYVANPAHVKEYRKSLGSRAKTDKKDSIVLARFLDSREHHPWQPEPDEVRQLQAMLSRLEALNIDLLRERNRLEKAELQRGYDRATQSIKTVISALEQEREQLNADIEAHINHHPAMQDNRRRLRTIPGVGPVLAIELLALLHSGRFNSGRQSAAFVGLIPLADESGNEKKPPRLSKTGRARLRSKLYMGAVVAKQHNPCIKAQYQRLLGRRKSPMCAIGAAMRKLVQIAFGVIKHQTDYSPQAIN